MKRRIQVLQSIFLVCVVTPACAQDAATPSIAAEDKAYSGHYYLSGIREVGSELLLLENETYQWFLSYGAVDQSSKGTWQRAGEEIVLLPRPVEQSGPWFSLGEVGPWDEAFEQDVQDAEFAERNGLVSQRCKFLADAEYANTPTASAISAYNEVVTDADRIAATKAEAEEVTARARYENASFLAMAGDGDSNELHEAARSARYAWLNALDNRYQARGIARLPYEKRPEALLPAGCQYEEWPLRAGKIEKTKWTQGVGVFVNDPETGSHFNRIDVRFKFADGDEVQQRIKSGGRTWVPTKPDRKVIGVSVKIELEFEMHEQAFELPAMHSGSISIILPAAKLIEPAFKEMRLMIDGDTLVGFDGQGRYDRAN